MVHKRESEFDWAKVDPASVRGICDEAHWDEFVVQAGGVRFDKIVPNAAFKNADYVFHEFRAIAELKEIKTEFFGGAEFRKKFERYRREKPSLSAEDARKHLLKIMREPLVRIMRTANRQIRETKKFLGGDDWIGTLICINHDFRSVKPWTVMQLFENVLRKPDFESIDSVNYNTNHFVELPGHPHPSYFGTDFSKKNDYYERSVDFNRFLGEGWDAYRENVSGPFIKAPQLSERQLIDARVVNGPKRQVP